MPKWVSLGQKAWRGSYLDIFEPLYSVQSQINIRAFRKHFRATVKHYSFPVPVN